VLIKKIVNLRKPSKESSLEEGFKIIDILDDALKIEKGVGLAANQIGIQRKVCIVRIPHQENNEKIVIGHNFINPIIVKKENPIIFENEGCLSFPDVFLKTLRYNNIVVKDLLSPQGRVFNGLEAVIIQHETDHTLGKIMQDSLIKNIGPNNRCPCDSEKKFKKCCMKELNKK